MKWIAALLGAIGVAGALGPSSLHARSAAPISSAIQAPTVNYSTHYFTQVIDHFPQEPRYAPHDNGTFKQRYYLYDSYYKPGGPVILFIGGETGIDYWTPQYQQSIILQIMQELNGMGIILENRYYGDSYPFNTSTTDQLAYMTTEQTLADLDSFARKAKIPGFKDINAPKGAPWILYGGSLAGALSAFAMKTYGNTTFYAGIASSGVINAFPVYPQWYDPIQLLAPQDCVASINGIVDKMDMLVQAKQTSAINQLKQLFGLEALTDIRDFAATIAFPLGGPLAYTTNSWQEINWNPEFGSGDFFDFCRNVTAVNATNAKIDLEFANYTNNEPWLNLGNYAAYVKRVVLPTCPSGDYNSPACFGTQHPSFWANTSNTEARSYQYTLCTELGTYQAAHQQGPTLVSRVLTSNYTQQWCDWSFPKGKYNSIPSSPDLNRWNMYGGLNLTADRLLFVDGTADPWQDMCHHSHLAPEREWTPLQPEYLINGAGHVWDLPTYADLASEPQFIRETHYFEARTVANWVTAFSSWTPGS